MECDWEYSPRMRFRFKPSLEQRSNLRAQLARLQQPDGALDILRPILPADFEPADVSSSVASVHADRFVMQAQVSSAAGKERAYALKVYADDIGQHIWAHAQNLAERLPLNHHGICLPIAYVPEERMLVFPWVEGRYLSEIVDDRKPELLRLAARIAADLHRLAIVPGERTTAQMLFDETRARCDRLRARWPGTTAMIEPLMASLEESLAFLDPADPSPVHGDLAAGQFLWTGNRLVLLDLDMFGYTDPAYDAGHFLAQLKRRCLVDPKVRTLAPQWLGSFRESYLEAMPMVSLRNISFYRGMTLIRKIYTICRREPARWPQLVPKLANHARQALQEVASPDLHAP